MFGIGTLTPNTVPRSQMRRVCQTNGADKSRNSHIEHWRYIRNHHPFCSWDMLRHTWILP